MKANKKIKPIWEDYRNWEDYKNGMYENGHSDDIINQCYEISTQVNFTNQMFNPVSWLGQATCNRLISATAQETCNAWMMMSKDQQEKANNIAKEVIEEWRNKYENL